MASRWLPKMVLLVAFALLSAATVQAALSRFDYTILPHPPDPGLPNEYTAPEVGEIPATPPVGLPLFLVKNCESSKSKWQVVAYQPEDLASLSFEPYFRT